jgi:hypothetical protein
MRQKITEAPQCREPRRSFLARLLAGGAFLLAGAGGRPLKAGLRLDRMRAEDFTELGARRFRLKGPAGAAWKLELVEVRAHPPDRLRPRAGLRPRPFSLLFSGPAAESLPQGTYRVWHPELGTFELFLVPVGPFEEGGRFEAVFN